MDKQILQIEERIKRNQEQLKKLQLQKAQLMKKEQERKAKEKENWYLKLRQGVDEKLSFIYGADYVEKIVVEEVVQIFITAVEGINKAQEDITEET